MRLHRVKAAAVVPLIALVLALGGGAAPARAAPHHPAHPAAAPARAAATFTSKVTLPETSIDGPGLSSALVASGPSESVIGWTGTDAAHSLNLLYPAYLPRLDSTKATLRETALGGPALGYLGGRRLALLWTGTDPRHHLNFATIDV